MLSVFWLSISMRWNNGGRKWKYEYKYRRGRKTLCALYAKESCNSWGNYNWAFKTSPLNKGVWFASIPLILPILGKEKSLNFFEIQGFTSFCLLKKWCHQQENYCLLYIDYHHFIVSSIWKSTWFGTRLYFIVLLAIRTILFSNISLFIYCLGFS